jgi:hypothetical protein
MREGCGGGGRRVGERRDFLLMGVPFYWQGNFVIWLIIMARARASAFAFRNDECKVIWIWLLFDITPPIKQNHYYTSQ